MPNSCRCTNKVCHTIALFFIAYIYNIMLIIAVECAFKHSYNCLIWQIYNYILGWSTTGSNLKIIQCYYIFFLGVIVCVKTLFKLVATYSYFDDVIIQYNGWYNKYEPVKILWSLFFLIHLRPASGTHVRRMPPQCRLGKGSYKSRETFSGSIDLMDNPSVTCT